MRPERFTTLFILVFALISESAIADVRLPKLIGDGMILQRNAKVKVWGWAEKGEKVSITFQNKDYHTVTGDDGSWMIVIPTARAGGPFQMQIKGKNSVAINNILLGDVWLCSGQSNMVLPMERVKERYGEVIASSANSSIRQFVVPTQFNFSGPQHDVAEGSWSSADPNTVLKFSAVGYFFARELFRVHKVPIGLIVAAVGGTPVEAWMSVDALKNFPQHLATLKIFDNDHYRDSISLHDKEIRNKWYDHLQRNDAGIRDSVKWYSPSADPHRWSDFQLPGFWSDQGLPNVNGAVWIRKEIDVPASFIGKPVKFFMGRIVDQDSVYVNGAFVGTVGYQYPPRRYEIPAGILHEGKNWIVIRVINTGGKGGFIKDKTYQLRSGDEVIDLEGKWQYKLGVSTPPLPPSTSIQYKPAGLFNAMISPLVNYALKGAIWYQGEANTSRPSEYQSLFTSMIKDWRTKWAEGDFPFLFVQLANFMEVVPAPQESQWAELREAQRKSLSLPNTAMAVAIDLGEWNDIHPLNKKDVGERLALAARKIAYHEKNITHSGPVFKSMKVKGNEVTLRFSLFGSNLKNTGEIIHGFTIAGTDMKFFPANAVIENNKVTVWSESVRAPVIVRYAWADNPEGANLYNTEGLPASPFQTDY